MRYRNLKLLGADVSEIGFGTWPLSGDVNGTLAYGKTNEYESRNALNKAYDSGINLYDVSDFYGYGYVESILGQTFEYKRNSIVIITKVGMISNEGKQNFSSGYIIDSLEGSLERLRTKYVDVYMLHSPSLSALKDPQILWVLNQLQKTGKIKSYGISLISPNDGFEAINKYGFKIIEVNYNLLDHRANNSGLFQLCLEKDVSVIVRTPLAQGLLSGKFEFNNDPTDRRNSWSKTRVEDLKKIYKNMLSHIKEKRQTEAQNCLRFCLSHSAVTSVIPGMKLTSEVGENTNASYSDNRLSKEELSLIQEEYKKERL